MTTIFKRTNDALATLNPAVEKSLAPYKGSSLPAVYITYQLVTSEAEQSADDLEKERSYIVQVNVFSQNGIEGMPDIDTAMLAAGFKKAGQRQLPQDPESRHYGIATDYVYLETKE